MSAADDYVDRIIGAPGPTKADWRRFREKQARKAAEAITEDQRRALVKTVTERLIEEVERYLGELRDGKPISNPSLHMLVGGLIPMQDADEKRGRSTNRSVLRLCERIIDDFGPADPYGPPR